MRINFVMLSAPKITGGPLAILEYAERLHQRGHTVSITTNPPFTWGASSPFPWFKFSGNIYFDRTQSPAQPLHNAGQKVLRAGRSVLRNLQSAVLRRPVDRNDRRYRLLQKRTQIAFKALLAEFGLGGALDFSTFFSKRPEDAYPLHPFYGEGMMAQFFMNAMPECDVNIATLWSTAIPVYFSSKGRPAIFMQHYEEIFYPVERNTLVNRLLTRLALSLPIYKIANSSWLAKQFEQQYGQKIPFANNALVIDDFSPRPKKSEKDGILRVVTYSRPEEWKGFQDAVAAMQMVLKQFGEKVEWHVFGYQNPAFLPENPYAPYRYHPKLSFSELAQLYAESDATLCPSWYESFPLPPLESMASGTAVVTTEYGTEDYAFNEENALVVNARDVNGMAQAVLRLLQDADLRRRLAKAGRTKAEEYTWDHAVDVREQMLEDICNGAVNYDLFATAQTGIVDHDGIPFETSFSESKKLTPKLIRMDRQHVYLLQNGCKRLIVDVRTLTHHKLRNTELVDIDVLTASRIPTGHPIRSVHDINL
jgi:glycosyltransferase involved in cell wall biosynthesis